MTLRQRTTLKEPNNDYAHKKLYMSLKIKDKWYDPSVSDIMYMFVFSATYKTNTMGIPYALIKLGFS